MLKEKAKEKPKDINNKRDRERIFERETKGVGARIWNF